MQLLGTLLRSKIYNRELLSFIQFPVKKSSMFFRHYDTHIWYVQVDIQVV